MKIVSRQISGLNLFGAICKNIQDGSLQAVIFLKPVERLRTEAGGITLESLGSGIRNQQVEPFPITVEPGSGNIDQPITHSGEEFVYCLQGEVAYMVGDRVYALEAACSLLFDASLPHGFSCKGEKPARLLMVFHTAEGGHLARLLQINND